MKIISLDIGTTSIGALCIDSSTGKILKSLSGNNAFIESDKSFEKIQDASRIFDISKGFIDSLIDEFSPVSGIGITGQMHGILYYNESGAPVSPLYTWQDMSSAETDCNGKTYLESYRAKTGLDISAGYGIATLFTHTEKHTVPSDCVGISTIHDYTGMKLCGNKRSVTHSSDAASLGAYDIINHSFCYETFKKAGIDDSILPEVTDNAKVIGKYRDIPVSVAIGDNQASFIGSVKDIRKGLLVNIGTGSQISFLSDNTDYIEGTEIRPLDGDKYIRVGSSLCGGRAFAAVEKFIRECSSLCGNSIENAYPFIDKLLAESSEDNDKIIASTKYCGTRFNPDERGSFSNISIENFTPKNFIYAVLHGISNELFQMYNSCPGAECSELIGSGNGLAKNNALKEIIEKDFSMNLMIPSHKEEACYGAAIYALYAIGECKTLEEAQQIIQYK